MKTSYVGDASAVSELIQALGIPEVVGAYGYMMELQTTTEPYGILLNFERGPMLRDQDQAFFHYMGYAGRCLLALVDNAETFSWRYDKLYGSSGGTVTMENYEEASFQELYDFMQKAAGKLLAAQAQDTLKTTEVLHLSEAYTFDDWSYSGTFTVQPTTFTATWTSLLSSAWPETETVEGFQYCLITPDEVLDYYPNADNLPLTNLLTEYCYAIYDADSQDTGYRILELVHGDARTTDFYVAHMTFSGEVQDWVMDYLAKAELTSQ